MTEPEVLHAAVVTALQSIGSTRLTVFDADVPTKPSALPDGRVLPYAVVWPSAGGAPLESPIAGATGLDWSCQVTVAAGDVGWCLGAIGLVRGALSGAVLAEGVTLTDETPRSLIVRRDPDVTPSRWFLPLQFGCLTP